MRATVESVAIRHLIARHDLSMANWIIQANPKVWDVFSWWENEDDPLDHWTLSWAPEEVVAGEGFALWIGGQEAGIYATGRLASGAYPEAEPEEGEWDPYWLEPPTGSVYGIDLDTELYLFDRPIRKPELQADPDFATALIIRMPRSRNPIKLTDTEWSAIRRRLPLGARRGRSSRRSSTTAGDVVVTERPLGTVVDETMVVTPSIGERTRKHREAQLVRAYEKLLSRPLVVRTAALPTGERLVVDAYDPIGHRLIEAKASASRQDVRMAIGQLLDYQRHIDPKASLAILLPEEPSIDLLDLLTALNIETLVREGKGFQITRRT